VPHPADHTAPAAPAALAGRRGVAPVLALGPLEPLLHQLPAQLACNDRVHGNLPSWPQGQHQCTATPSGVCSREVTQSGQSRTWAWWRSHQTVNMWPVCGEGKDPASDFIDYMRENPAMASRPKRHTVAAVIGHETSPFELAVACEVFGIDRSEDFGVPWYRFMVVAAEEPPIRAATGFTIDTPYRLDSLRKADTIVVPARSGAPEAMAPQLIDALRAAHRRGARILSVCTGAFALAEAGLLDGKRATTHWFHAAEMARRYPNVKVDPDVLYVDEGDVMTSAGTAAGIDLMLHVVRQDFGGEIANALARRMVVPPHRDGGQAQFVDEPMRDASDGDLFGDTLAFMEQHLGEVCTIDDLAARSAMSPRTFARRFRAATGTTPHQWLTRQRVLLAQRLLETSDESIDRVAERCGFGSAAALRPHFQRIVRTSPMAYRKCFFECP
jgi:transcriptional regulator GlxA family with amidase domain